MLNEICWLDQIHIHIEFHHIRYSWKVQMKLMRSLKSNEIPLGVSLNRKYQKRLWLIQFLHHFVYTVAKVRVVVCLCLLSNVYGKYSKATARTTKKCSSKWINILLFAFFLVSRSLVKTFGNNSQSKLCLGDCVFDGVSNGWNKRPPNRLHEYGSYICICLLCIYDGLSSYRSHG